MRENHRLVVLREPRRGPEVRRRLVLLRVAQASSPRHLEATRAVVVPTFTALIESYRHLSAVA